MCRGVLFTTNCLMPPRPSYADRVFTTAVVAYRDLSISLRLVERRTSLSDKQGARTGRMAEDRHFTRINGGSWVMTGFARNTVRSAEKSYRQSGTGYQAFFLVGGCDGAKPGRNYYTDFVKNTPKDTVILTLACGKFRFNDLDLGEIGGLPRIMDMGQCNDAYSAILVAIALEEAFNCSVNELPLTLVLSWYEQKAVCILLTLLALGLKNIYIGPTFGILLINVLKVLVDKFGIKRLLRGPEGDTGMTVSLSGQRSGMIRSPG